MDELAIVEFIYHFTVILYYVLIPIFFLTIIFSIKEHWKAKQIKAKTYELRKDLTNEKVSTYITFIDSLDVPNRKVYREILKAGYYLIDLDNSIEENLKRQLRTTMLSKGLLVGTITKENIENTEI